MLPHDWCSERGSPIVRVVALTFFLFYDLDGLGAGRVGTAWVCLGRLEAVLPVSCCRSRHGLLACAVNTSREMRDREEIGRERDERSRTPASLFPQGANVLPFRCNSASCFCFTSREALWLGRRRLFRRSSPYRPRRRDPFSSTAAWFQTPVCPSPPSFPAPHPFALTVLRTTPLLAWRPHQQAPRHRAAGATTPGADAGWDPGACVRGESHASRGQ